MDSFPDFLIAELPLHPIVAASPETDAASVIREMRSTSASAAVLSSASVPGLLTGIVTHRDIAHCYALQPERNSHIGAMASAPVIAVGGQDTAHYALALMDKHRISALPVCNDLGQPLGLIFRDDIWRVPTQSGFVTNSYARFLNDEQAGGESTRALIDAIPQLVLRWLEQGVATSQIQASLQQLERMILQRAYARSMEVLEANMGPCPRQVAVMCTTLAHERILLGQRQRYALIIQDTHASLDEDEDRWFFAFADEMAKWLDQSGMVLDDQTLVATEPRWRRSEAGWASTVSSLFANCPPDTESFALRCLSFSYGAGSLALAGSLRRTVLGAVRRKRFFLSQHLALQAGRTPLASGRPSPASGRTPLASGRPSPASGRVVLSSSLRRHLAPRVPWLQALLWRVSGEAMGKWRHRIVTHDLLATLYLRGYIPILTAIRALAWVEGSHAMSSDDQLADIVAAGHLRQDFADDVRHALALFEHVILFYRAHARDTRDGLQTHDGRQTRDGQQSPAIRADAPISGVPSPFLIDAYPVDFDLYSADQIEAALMIASTFFRQTATTLSST
ncbi:MAG: CBS domain-containing protein [Alphaproteobacteria bacterium]|nr:CBS domain-containing protein [Alphaproteobacteria bacterium]